MKKRITVEFYIENYEDMEEYETFMKSNDYYCALVSIQERIRAYKKYGLPADLQNHSVEEVLERLYEEVWEILSENDIAL